MNKLKLYLLFGVFFFIISTYAQSNNLHYTISWKNKQEFFAPNAKTLNEASKFILYFDGASYEHQQNHLPVFTNLLPLNAENKHAKIINAKYIALTQNDIAKVYDIDKINDNLIIKNEILFARKQKFVKFSFIPLRKNKATQRYEKLVSFDIELVNYAQIKARKRFKASYKNASVLSTGKWVKIKIDKSGVYKLSYDELKNLGINNPKNVRVFGNGGKMLLFYNSESKLDDLQELKILKKNNTIYFYAQSTVQWVYDKGEEMFVHNINLYSKYAYYFLSSDYNSGYDNKISAEVSPSLSASNNVSSFDALAYHEIDSINLIGSGRIWLGEVFNFTTEYNFSFDTPNLIKGSKIKLKTSLLARSPITSSFNITCAGQSLSVNLPSTNYHYTSSHASVKQDKFEFNAPSSNKIDVQVSYNKNTASAKAWLDYLIINARQKLLYNGRQFEFRDYESAANGNITQFNISSANSNVLVWDVSKPNVVKQMSTSLNGTTLSFKQNTDTIKEFIAFELSSAYSPITSADDLGVVANQNLHGIKTADFVIVSHPEFLSYANDLKQIHNKNDKLKVVVVSTQQVYNEFSSGAPDVSAIRNFMKMLYDRAKNDSELPKYLCLFGDGSYDNKHNFDGNTNFILTYQSENSLSPTQSFVTDDYFGLLDDDEGEHVGLLDIGIGRFPVKNKLEAEAMIQKIRNYQSVNALGDWKNSVCFIADDEDGNLHMSQSNLLSKILENKYPYLNIEKIFLDAYTQKSSSKGQRYPDVVLEINNQIDRGILLLNYTGHGGKTGLAEERIITSDQIKKWRNSKRLPVFMTATCEFSRFDYYDETTAGEQVFLNPQGGAIAMFTTTRLVYASPNFNLNQKFYSYFFEKESINNRNYRLGDIMRLTKNATGSDINKRNFTLFGDPALQVAYPRYSVKTNTVNSHVASRTDTISAFDKLLITGEIQDEASNKITNYNGILHASVFDKKQSTKSLNNDGDGVFEYKTQNSQIFRGKVSVKNGNFKFQFVVPKDIKYNIDTGKISYYADNKKPLKDAKGSYSNILIGGLSNSENDKDKIGPAIDLYFNDESFVDGGTTNSTPNLLVKLNDESGINTTDAGIGHDIIATIDNDRQKRYTLNTYYESDVDDFTRGKINYKLPKLEPGEHVLHLKAWDVFNNSSVDSIRFNVIENKEFAISHVLNYPNPFSTNTSFFFEHNRPNEILEVFIHVFSASGKIVKTIKTEVLTNGFRSNGIKWNGKGDYGNNIGRGVYFYKLSVRTKDGEKAEKFEKLMILN